MISLKGLPQVLWIVGVALTLASPSHAEVPPPHGKASTPAKKVEKDPNKPLLTVDNAVEIRNYASPHSGDKRTSLKHFGIVPTLVFTIDNYAEHNKPRNPKIVEEHLEKVDDLAKSARDKGVDVVLLYFPFNGEMLDTPKYIERAKLRYTASALLRQFGDGRLTTSAFYDALDKGQSRDGSTSWYWFNKPGEVSARGIKFEDKRFAELIDAVAAANKSLNDDAKEIKTEIARLNFKDASKAIERLKNSKEEPEIKQGFMLETEMLEIAKQVRAGSVDYLKEAGDLPAYYEALEAWEDIVDGSSLEEAVSAELKQLKADKDLKNLRKVYKDYKEVRDLFDYTRARIVDPNRLSYEHWYGEKIRTNEEIAKPAAKFLKKHGKSRYAEHVKQMAAKAVELVAEAKKGLEEVKKVGKSGSR